jgi:hypothetical protein
LTSTGILLEGDSAQNASEDFTLLPHCSAAPSDVAVAKSP